MRPCVKQNRTKENRTEQNKTKQKQGEKKSTLLIFLLTFPGYVKCIGLRQAAGKASANSLKYILLIFLFQLRADDEPKVKGIITSLEQA